MSGTGTMAPNTGNLPPTTEPTIFRPPVVTALSLAEYASIMGINPIQFMSGNSFGYFPSTGCTDRWMQYAWQDEAKVSRDELAREIQQAEKDIAAALGYYPGEKWITSDKIPYPRYHKRPWTGATGQSVRGYHKTIRLKNGMFVANGVRSATLVDTVEIGAGITFLDQDGDSLNETAVITCSTTHASVYKHRLFFEGHGGLPEYEIRPAIYKAIAGGVITIHIPVWQLFRPDLLGAFPGPDGFTDLDPSDTNNLVSEIDVYYIDSDPSVASYAHWNQGDVYFDTIGETSQTVHLSPLEIVNGEVAVKPGVWDVTNLVFTGTNWSVYREPDYVKASYLSGDFIEDPISGEWRVPDDLAKAITWMATARLSRPLCILCQNVKDKEEKLMMDLSFTARGETGDVRFVTPRAIRNPFGTKVGELEAWGIIQARLNSGPVSRKSAAL